MMKQNVREEIFNRLYSASSEEERILFDNPNTRKQASVLYAAWRDYQATQKRRKKAIVKKEQELTSEPQFRDLTCSEVLDGLEGLQIVGEALYYRILLQEGRSKEDAMREVTCARLSCKLD